MDSEITVMIPSYNPGGLLKDAIYSVHKQTYTNWKVIIVDDASTDDSLQQAEMYLNDPRVTILKNEVNLGQGRSQNRALEAVTTRFLVQLDSDDWFFPHTIERLLDVFRSQPPDVAVVSGNIQIVNSESIYDGQDQNRPQPYILRGRFFKDRYDFLLSNKSLWPRCYRSSALRNVGGWPTDDPFDCRHMEDRRMLNRLIEKYRFHWIDEVLYVHRRHDYNHTHKLDVYNEIIEWEVRNILKRWGDRYEPVFVIDPWGWKMLAKLKRKGRTQGDGSPVSRQNGSGRTK